MANGHLLIDDRPNISGKELHCKVMLVGAYILFKVPSACTVYILVRTQISFHILVHLKGSGEPIPNRRNLSFAVYGSYTISLIRSCWVVFFCCCFFNVVFLLLFFQ